MRKVALVWVGHEDYLCPNSDAIQKEIIRSLSGIASLDTSYTQVATSPALAVEAVRNAVGSGDCCGAVIVFLTWVECSVVMAAYKELRGMPCMFWGFPLETVNGVKESTGSYVSATMFAGIVQRLSLPCSTIYSSWNDEKCIRRIECFSRAAVTYDALNYTKIGLFGYTSMSIYTGTFDHVLMRYFVGPEIEQMDTYSLIREAEAVSEDEIAEACKLLKTHAAIADNVKSDVLKRTMAMYVALKKMCERNAWNAVNVKCQYELSKEYKLVPCVALSLLSESGVTASCEGDMCNTVSMLMLNYLTGQTAWYGDSLTQWDNVVQFSPCGFMPFSLGNGTPVVQKFMEHPGFSGIQVSGVLRPERVTFVRLVEEIGSYHLLVGTGKGIATEMRGGCMPALNVELDGKIEDLQKEYAGQHYAIVYGDWSEELEALSGLLGIEYRKI